MRDSYDARTARDRAESAEQHRKDAQELESVRAAYKDATGRLVELTRLEVKRAVLFGFGERMIWTQRTVAGFRISSRSSRSTLPIESESKATPTIDLSVPA